jgi:hypothetical protein
MVQMTLYQAATQVPGATSASEYGRFLESVYTTALTLRGSIISRGIIHYRNGVQRRFHRLVLPLSADGTRIDTLLYSTVGFALAPDDPVPPADDILACDGSIIALAGRG